MKIKYFLLIGFLLIQTSFPQENEIVRILTYNLLNYPDNYNIRDQYYKKVIDEINPDIVVVQEITSQTGVNIFTSDVLGTSFAAGTFINGPDTDNAIFYKYSSFTFISNVAISTSLRNISQFTLYNNLTLDTLIIYSVHLKASDGSSNEQQRLNEVTTLRNATDALPYGQNYIVVGDFNIYYSGEPAYQKLIDQSSSGYFVDPLIAGNWHNNSVYSSYHTQSTCNLTSCPNGGSNGGLDDRFDMILISQAVSDTGGIEFISGSYTPFGNDGQHFNKSINEPPFNIITQEIANALFQSSDHLPVFADFDFGPVSEVNDINYTITTFNLYQNYPNPFNPTTKIRFELPHSSYTKLVVYDLLGREVKILFEGEAFAGMNEVDFDAENLAAGIYLYTLFTDDFIATKKLMLLK
ncbi:MAG: T9SS type A sorting domain-containing protein [Ignavibacteriaceae bacterium]